VSRVKIRGLIYRRWVASVRIEGFGGGGRPVASGKATKVPPRPREAGGRWVGLTVRAPPRPHEAGGRGRRGGGG
jgi:hypothetical protein